MLKFIETCNLKHLYINKLDKAYFAHDAAYSDGKELAKKAISDKVLKAKAYEIARNFRYQGALASMIYNSFEKK